MHNDRDKQVEADQDRREPNILPATEISSNPNPRANENIRGRQEEETDSNDSGTGSEITDGEGG